MPSQKQVSDKPLFTFTSQKLIVKYVTTKVAKKSSVLSQYLKSANSSTIHQMGVNASEWKMGSYLQHTMGKIEIFKTDYTCHWKWVMDHLYFPLLQIKHTSYLINTYLINYQLKCIFNK